MHPPKALISSSKIRGKKLGVEDCEKKIAHHIFYVVGNYVTTSYSYCEQMDADRNGGRRTLLRPKVSLDLIRLRRRKTNKMDIHTFEL